MKQFPSYLEIKDIIHIYSININLSKICRVIIPIKNWVLPD